MISDIDLIIFHKFLGATIAQDLLSLLALYLLSLYLKSLNLNAQKKAL